MSQIRLTLVDLPQTRQPAPSRNILLMLRRYYVSAQPCALLALGIVDLPLGADKLDLRHLVFNEDQRWLYLMGSFVHLAPWQYRARTAPFAIEAVFIET